MLLRSSLHPGLPRTSKKGPEPLLAAAPHPCILRLVCIIEVPLMMRLSENSSPRRAT